MSEIAKLHDLVGGRTEAIEKAKAEVMHEVETRESWPVLDAALEKLCAEFESREPRRAGDQDDADWTGERGAGRMESAAEAESSRQRFTKEQIVSAVIIFLATIATNAVVVWIIVKSLEGVTK
jgi:hypothetical protein